MTDKQKLTDLRLKLQQLHNLREDLGEQIYLEKVAKIEAEIRVLGSVIDLTGEPEDRLKFILQSRHVNVSTDASGNIIITGDNNIVLTLPPEKSAAPALLSVYLRSLAAECSRLPLGLIHEEFTTPGVENQVTLQSVYTDLDVVSPPAPEGEQDKAEQRWLGLRMERGEGERVSLLSAISEPDAPWIVLLGMPGSGKTTFVNYVTACLAGGESHTLPESLRSYLPVRLALRDVTAYLPLDGRAGSADMLWNALEAELARRLSQTSAKVVLPILQARLAREGGLVLLDGLDEVPEAGRRRKCLVDAIAAWKSALPKCRFLLTARPYAYANPQWQLPDFQTLVLAPFNPEQAERFIQHWYEAVRFAQGWTTEEARIRAQELVKAVEERAYLADMASRPLLLTLMATLHSHRSRLPEDRAELYEFSIGLLLSRWQKGRMALDEQGNPYLEQGMEKVLKLDDSRLRGALEGLALSTHYRQRASEGGQTEAAEGIPADIPLSEVLAAFNKQLPHDLNADLVIEYLENRSGLLIGRGEGIYTFPHRSFQEYLAACRLANAGDAESDYAQRLCDLVKEDLDWWREVFLLGVGKQRLGGESGAVDILNRLAPVGVSEIIEPTGFQWRAAALAAEGALDLRLPEKAGTNDYFLTILKRLRGWLAALLEGGHLPPRECLVAGDLLGRLGDPRRGVGVIDVNWQGKTMPLPDIDWVFIPEGEFLMGSSNADEQAYSDEKPQHRLALPGFWVARHPVTNVQFRPFVEGDGYENPDYWTEEGWVWRQGADPDLTPLDSFDDQDFSKSYKAWVLGRLERGRPFWWEDNRWGAATRPVVGVSWYEARAYCEWLATLYRKAGIALNQPADVQRALAEGASIHLPGEAQWEKAARGGDGRVWPWQGDWRKKLANTNESELGETSPVGMFPGGAHPFGLQDMAGNVWEWTRSKWGMQVARPDFGYPYMQDDGREDEAGPDFRVVRGGSWNDNRRYARCAFRYGFMPTNFDFDLGFRLVLSLANAEF